MDHDSLHLSASSATTSSILSDAPSETTSVDDLHHALILSQEIKLRTRRDPEPITKRDTPVMKSARSRGGGDILNSQSTHEMSNKKKDAPMMLLKLAKKEGVQRTDMEGAARKEGKHRVPSFYHLSITSTPNCLIKFMWKSNENEKGRSRK